MLGSFWSRFDPILGCFGPFWTLFGHFFLPIIAPFLGHFCPLFGVLRDIPRFFLVVFWEGDCKIKRNDAREGKLCKFLPKLTQMMQNCATASPFSAVKHLFRLKTGQNRRFNLWKYAVSGCVWKCPEWILSVFMHFYEGPHYFWPFWPVWSHFWPYPGLYRAFLGRNFWCRFSVVLTPFWALLGPFLSRFWTLFGPFLPVCEFLWCFGKLTAKLSTMMQEKAQLCNFLPKCTKIIQNCAKTGVFLILWNLFNGASDLEFEFYTEDLVKEKQ